MATITPTSQFNLIKWFLNLVGKSKDSFHLISLKIYQNKIVLGQKKQDIYGSNELIFCDV